MVASSVPKIAEWSLESVSDLTLENHGDKRALEKITNFVQQIKTADESLFDKLMEKIPTKSKAKLDQCAKLELDSLRNPIEQKSECCDNHH